MPQSSKAPSLLPYRPCVGIMLINHAGLIWAGQRIDNQNDVWQMPQGGIDKGEAASDAALRELWEETGITEDKVSPLDALEEWLTYDLPPELVGKLWKGKYRGQKQKWYAFRYEGKDSDVQIDRTNAEFRSWCWMDAKRLEASVIPFKQAVYHHVIEAFAQHVTP